jgi:hypothetical protein
MSAFALAIPPPALANRLHRPRQRSATEQLSVVSLQWSDSSSKFLVFADDAADRATCARSRHSRSARRRHSAPQRSRGRAHTRTTASPPPPNPTHNDIAPELGIRARLPPRPFGQQRANRLRRTPQLISHAAVLLEFRKTLTRPMQIKRQRISPPEHLQRPYVPAHPWLGLQTLFTSV